MVLSTRDKTKDIINVLFMMSGWTFTKSLNIQRLVFGLLGKLTCLGMTFCLLFSMVLTYTGSIRIRCNAFDDEQAYIGINDQNIMSSFLRPFCNYFPRHWILYVTVDSETYCNVLYEYKFTFNS